MFDPLQIPHVFRARSVRTAGRAVVPTGFDAVDSALAGGWPRPALIELLVDSYGIGELQLLLPLFRSLAAATNPSLLVWLNPPYLLNAVAFEQSGVRAIHWLARELPERDVLWAAEQSLRSRACAAVIAWSDAPATAALRRLKLAVTGTDGVAIVFRRLRDATQPSPANIRVALRPERDRLRVDVVKNEGRKPMSALVDARAHAP